MKRLIFCLVVVLALSGCVSTNVEKDGSAAVKNEKVEHTAENKSEIPKKTQDETEQKTKVEDIDYMQLYSDVLDRYHVYITHKVDIFGEGVGLAGLKEPVMFVDAQENLNDIGFTLKDTNSDGVPELLIGERNHYSDGVNQILAAYTLKDGEPKLLFEGWSRNRYYVTSNDGFFNEGSGGAAYNVTTLYSVNEDGYLICKGQYFTLPNDESGDADYYYNTHGDGEDPETSLKFSAEKLDELYPEFDEWRKQRIFVELTPFAEYTVSDKNSPPPVTVKWESEVGEDVSDYKAFHPYDSSGIQKVVFYTDEIVTDFKVLSIEETGFDENYNSVYSIDELYTLEELAPNEPFVVSLLDYEYIPRNGFSYIDKNGRSWRFAISQSGYDGSMILEQF